MYYKRKIDLELLLWSEEEHRKPLLLRGARQVGKSSAVRELAKQFEYFAEVNFESQRQLHTVFSGDINPRNISNDISLFLNVPIIPGKTLLFFDEIQSCPAAISSLRFFYEQYPELHLIAAGSLLEFALSDLPSFGVGRVRSIFMYPFSFYEFLSASGEDLLLKAVKGASPEQPLSDLVHSKLNSLLKKFMIIGGMPEVVSNYVSGKDLLACQQILDDLLISLQADFSKYKARVPSVLIQEVFSSVVRQSGNRFVYSRAMPETGFRQIKDSLELLIMAGLVIPVSHTSANGLPLGAETDFEKRKMLLLDTGLFQRISGLNISELLLSDDFKVINRGALAELFAGLELLKSTSCYRQAKLYYWHREARSSNAEVDYLLQKDDTIIPIEIKSGKRGSMQSLFLFLKEKGLELGVRSSMENFSRYDKIEVYPLYALSNIVQLTAPVTCPRHSWDLAHFMAVSKIC